jgi:hypothetical protein
MKSCAAAGAWLSVCHDGGGCCGESFEQKVFVKQTAPSGGGFKKRLFSSAG